MTLFSKLLEDTVCVQHLNDSNGKPITQAFVMDSAGNNQIITRVDYKMAVSWRFYDLLLDAKDVPEGTIKCLPGHVTHESINNFVKFLNLHIR